MFIITLPPKNISKPITPNITTETIINTTTSGTPTEFAAFSDMLLIQLKIIIITFPTALKAPTQSDTTRSDLYPVNKVAKPP